MTQTTIYLDVDGVLNAVAGGRNPRPGSGGWDEWTTLDGVLGFPISYAPEMLRRVEAWAALPGVEIAWLTTWEDDAPKTLAPQIGLSGQDWRVVPYTVRDGRKFSEYSWWKLDAILEDWNGENRFVWIDDDLSVEHRALEWQRHTLQTVQSLVVSPNTRIALTRDHVDAVDKFLLQ